MPLYEYECRTCGKTFEEWGRMSDPPVSVCQFCGGSDVSRIISRTSGDVTKDAKTLYRDVIAPEARKIAERINNGDEDAAADILGDPSKAGRR